MTDVAKRRWFQFHLASAVVMLVVAGGMVGQNLKLRYHAGEQWRPAFMGWPCTFAFESAPDNYGRFDWQWALFPAVAINFATCMGIVIAAGVSAEAVLRYRNRRTQPTVP